MSKKSKTAEVTAAPAAIASAAVFARPQTDKLKKLGLAMCPSGKLFGAKKSCKCCGAVVCEASAPPSLPPVCAKHGAVIPCAKCLRAEKARNSRAAKKDSTTTQAAVTTEAPVAVAA